MVATFDVLPVELVDTILDPLDARSVGGMRAASRAVYDLCSGRSFLRYLAHQHVRITEDGLDRLALLAAHPLFRLQVTHLTLIGVVYDVDNAATRLKTLRLRKQSALEIERASAQLAWLQQQQSRAESFLTGDVCFKLSKIFQQLENLKELHVTVHSVRRIGDSPQPLGPMGTHEWPVACRAAGKLYQISMAAIVQSGIKLHTLNYLRPDSRCSVFVTDMTPTLDALAPHWSSTDCLQGLRQFHMGISAILEWDKWAKVDRTSFLGASPSSTAEFMFNKSSLGGFARLSKLMPSLDTIELHFYQTYYEQPPAGYERVFQYLNEEAHFPCLRACSLIGFPARQEDLLDWLQKHQSIEALTLEFVVLTTGTWMAVLQALSAMPRLCDLKLSSLRDVEGRFHLRGADVPGLSFSTHDEP